jgi:phosphate/sulfate permease
MIAIGYGAGEWIQTNVIDTERLKWSVLAVLIGILVCFYAVKLWRRNKFGVANGQARWSVIRPILLAWVLTVPIAGVTAAGMIYGILSRLTMG